MNRTRKILGAVACTSALLAAGEGDAVACGGFFCSQTQTVNQAAERIIFSENGDGTVTAVIQILYEGPSENFSWLLPISSVPQGDQLKVASDLAFQRLQAATNPQYFLNVQVEGDCAEEPDFEAAGAGGASAEGAGGEGPGSPVDVRGRGVVGPFEWEAIAVDPALPNPADVAVGWLEEHGYDIPEGTPGLLRPYLEDGLYLLALRLTKDASSGSIRPIMLTYDATKPSIPVRPTAVAANENMGVMAWVLSTARAVPQNYYSLELNEARLNWFNPSSNYDALVTAAADEAGGQGFVTERAGSTTLLRETVWTSYDEASLEYLRDNLDRTWAFNDAFYQWGGWDGFWDTARATLTPPSGASWSDVEADPFYFDLSEVSLTDPAFIQAFEANVIEPVRAVQELIDSRPVLTRLYTTLSAEEMTVDPLFTFNADLPDVSNVHTATQVIECAPEFYRFEAPFRVELPQGQVVRGAGAGRWPEEFDEQPANLRILQLSDEGDGRVLEDNEQGIQTAINTYNDTVTVPNGSAASGGTGGAEKPAWGGKREIGRAGATARGGNANLPGAGTDSGESGMDSGGPATGSGASAERATAGPLPASGCACAIEQTQEQNALSWAAAAMLAGLALARRRARRGPGLVA